MYLCITSPKSLCFFIFLHSSFTPHCLANTSMDTILALLEAKLPCKLNVTQPFPFTNNHENNEVASLDLVVSIAAPPPSKGEDPIHYHLVMNHQAPKPSCAQVPSPNTMEIEQAHFAAAQLLSLEAHNGISVNHPDGLHKLLTMPP